MISSGRFDELVIVPEHQLFMNRDRHRRSKNCDHRRFVRTKDPERQAANVTSVDEVLPSTVFPSDRGTLVGLTTEHNHCWRIRLSICPCDLFSVCWLLRRRRRGSSAPALALVVSAGPRVAWRGRRTTIGIPARSTMENNPACRPTPYP